MNTEQKAREWLAVYGAEETYGARGIIGALLAERQELLMHVHRLLFIAKHAQTALEKLKEQNNE